LDAALARREMPVRPYPDAIGRWPAVALIVAWSWCELVWDQAKNPGVLGAIILVYFAATLVGTRIFGAAAWLDNVEVFTVLSRTFARFAPTALEPRSPDEFAETPRDERRVRLRWFGAGVTTDPPLPRGGGAFVIALLATVIFDGFSQTTRYVDVAQWAIRQWSWLGQHPDVLATIVMAAIIAAFVAAYVLASLVGAAESSLDAAARYASTLVPIVAVYFAAHYFSYLLIAGQATLGVIVDPLTHGWNPGGLGKYELKKGWITGGSVWWTQVILIVWGHIVAIMAAHRVALERGLNRVTALRLQLPLVLLMVGFTIAGLWVLAQQLKVVA
jgi:hypothetical protein